MSMKMITNEEDGSWRVKKFQRQKDHGVDLRPKKLKNSCDVSIGYYPMILNIELKKLYFWVSIV
jgi:hypothetical protein